MVDKEEQEVFKGVLLVLEGEAVAGMLVEEEVLVVQGD